MLCPLLGARRPLVARPGPAATQASPVQVRASGVCRCWQPAYDGPRSQGRRLCCLTGGGQAPRVLGAELEALRAEGGRGQPAFPPSTPSQDPRRGIFKVTGPTEASSEGHRAGGQTARLRPLPHSCTSPAALDPCASSPCLNGGSCTNTQDPGSHHCTCPVGFTGKDCGTGERGLGAAGLGGGAPAACRGAARSSGVPRAGTHGVVPREMLRRDPLRVPGGGRQLGPRAPGPRGAVPVRGGPGPV